MSLPQNIEPSADKPAETSVPDAPEPVVVAEEEETPEEIASDSALRAWARDNGFEDVPTSGRLSAAWREQITNAMAAALDPKDEVSAEATSSDSSISVETTTEDPSSTDPEGSTDESNLDSTDEENPVEEPVAPEFETGQYRSVFKAPNTFVSSQAYTA
jgi:hypothetical protein